MVKMTEEEFDALGFDLDLDSIIITFISHTKCDPPKGSEMYNEMIDLGKDLLKRESLSLSPIGAMMLGEEFPFAALREAFGKCGLMEPLLEE